MVAKTAVCIVGILACCGWAVSADRPTTRPTNEFYIGGDVVRAGVWPIGEKPKSVLKAIDAAGLKDSSADYQITIIQIVRAHKLERTTIFNSLKALRESPEAATDLTAGDHVMGKSVNS